MSDFSLFSGDDSEASHVAQTYVRVVVERGIEGGAAPDGLTYACPSPALTPTVGERVLVPLGRSGKPTGGLVVEVGGPALLGDLKPSRVKPLAALTGAKLPEELIALARWMASYYVCPLGMVLAALLPAAVKAATGTKDVEFVRYSELGRSLRLAGESESLPKLGKAARAAWLRLAGSEAPPFPASLKSVLGAMEIKSPKGVRDLAAAGLLEFFHERTVAAAPLRLASGQDGAAPTPTEDQQRLIDGIGATFGSFKVHLIRGVTGAGKTEVYLRLIERALELGKSAIVLVPEISLTPQTSARFVARFGVERVAVLHSGLTSAQRNREWTRASTGAASVVVGARSAVFAPIPSLGLIVVDEEHDSSYKQDQLPRYNARDVAIKRGQIQGIPIVLGSATPSLESWANAIGNRFGLWELTRRAGGGVLPRVEVVDLREERRMRALNPDEPPGRIHQIGPTLETAIDVTLRERGQVVLFLNRRGFAHYVACPDPKCGYTLACDQCDANLVLHKGAHLPVGQLVKCHHCLAESLVPHSCPNCRKKLNPFGGGTQRVEAEICRKFAAYDIEEGRTLLRLDSDTMRNASDYFDALERFGRGDARILLGTQMIAKGLDFPGVRLVGVIDADTSLSVADYRAEERTFQLLSQVAGRAGRADAAGRVVVQTLNPELCAVRCAATHDYTSFATEELAVRAAAGLPPTTRMARIVSRDEDHDKASDAAAKIAEFLRGADASIEVRGPAPCGISRVAGFYRFEVILIAPTAGRVQGVLAAARAAGLVKSDSATAVDVDPLSLA